MGAAKNYLNDIICACSDQRFGQDAVEFAIQMGMIRLTGQRAVDIVAITARYDEICQAYRHDIERNEKILLCSYGPLMEVLCAADSESDAA